MQFCCIIYDCMDVLGEIWPLFRCMGFMSLEADDVQLFYWNIVLLVAFCQLKAGTAWLCHLDGHLEP